MISQPLYKTTLPLLMASLMSSCCVAEVIDFTGFGSGVIPNGYAGFKWTNLGMYFSVPPISFDLTTKGQNTGFYSFCSTCVNQGKASFEIPNPSADGPTFSLISLVERSLQQDPAVQNKITIEGYAGFGATLQKKATKVVRTTTSGSSMSVVTFDETFEGLTKVEISCETACALFIDDIVYLPSDDTDIVSFEDLAKPSTVVNYRYPIPPGHMGFSWSNNFFWGEKNLPPTAGDDKYEAYVEDGDSADVTFEKTDDTSLFQLKSMRLRSGDGNKPITVQGYAEDGSVKVSRTVNIKTRVYSYAVPFDTTQWTGLAKVSLHNSQGNFFVDDIVFKWENLVSEEEAAVDEYVVAKDDKPKKESMIAGGVVIGVVLMVSLFIVIHCGRKNQWSCLRKACGGRNGGKSENEEPVKAPENTLDETGPKAEADPDKNAVVVENV